MAILLSIVTALMLLATCLPLASNHHWIFRVMDFPWLQLALLALVLLLAQVIFLNLTLPLTWLLIATATACLLWQCWWILPYSKAWPREMKSAQRVDDKASLCILTSNVLTPNREAHKLIALVREHKPDLLMSLESDQWWEDQLSEIEDELRYTIRCPLDNLYGMHIYSRLPIEDPVTEYLVEHDVPSMHAKLRLRSGDSIRVHFLHPAPPSPTENPESAKRDAELIIVAQSVTRDPEPVIVTGDLNDVT